MTFQPWIKAFPENAKLRAIEKLLKASLDLQWNLIPSVPYLFIQFKKIK